ncbi:hypothetical protein K432DRAFT_439311 [Lepidopterella palustris CBS 459.81]|uniref:Pathogen-related protein n=1 Tax=Lepidopterella palustris CBS 459.81 TaxID=1314670 RepID=A0A8E2JK73_9PEZI|nr:hypothetical protein K432DRAFT_439311 [Lepidopterella palustris CBS 459.81]
MASTDVQYVLTDTKPELPDYLCNPDAVLKDQGATWRYGRAPDYSKTRKVYDETKKVSHVAGSLPELVQNLVKNWEIEASFKPNLGDWRTINRENYSFAINGGPPQTPEHMLRVGTYNAIIAPNEYFSPENFDFETSHKTFKRMMPTFAWEVLEVYSGPPLVTFRWRHWGTMKNDYVGFNNKGDKVTAKAHGGPIDIEGVTVATVDDKVRLQQVQTWFDPLEMFRQIAPNGVVNKEIVPKKIEATSDAEGNVPSSLTPNLTQGVADTLHPMPSVSERLSTFESALTPVDPKDNNLKELENLSRVMDNTTDIPKEFEVATSVDSVNSKESSERAAEPIQCLQPGSGHEIEVCRRKEKSMAAQELSKLTDARLLAVPETNDGTDFISLPGSNSPRRMDTDKLPHSSALLPSQEFQDQNAAAWPPKEEPPLPHTTVIPRTSEMKDNDVELDSTITLDNNLRAFPAVEGSAAKSRPSSSGSSGWTKVSLVSQAEEMASASSPGRSICSSSGNEAQEAAVKHTSPDEATSASFDGTVDQLFEHPAEVHPHPKDMEAMVKPGLGKAVASAFENEVKITHEEMSNITPIECPFLMNRE